MSFDFAVLMDEELFEERLVELSSELGWCVSVHLVAVLDERQAAGQGLFDLLERQISSGQLCLGARDRSGDAVLFDFEKVHRHAVGVVGVEQFLALGSELLKSTTRDSLGVLGAAAEVLEILAEQGVQQLRVLGVQSHRPVLGFDLLFDLMHGDVAPDTVGAFLVPPDAEEVLVGGAVPVGLLIEAEPTPAGAAEDAAA